jgi:H+-transporting ATPase
MVTFSSSNRGDAQNDKRNGDNLDVERGMSTATARSRSKSIYDVSALEGMDEYTALQNYITLYRDQRSTHVEQDSG